MTARNEAGAANVVVLALILPLILYLGYSGVMAAHLADVKITVETAARAAARDYASGGTVAHAQELAYAAVHGSLPTGGTIRPTTPSGSSALSGFVSYTGGNYDITAMSGVSEKVEPADNTVNGQLSVLAGQDVTTAGSYVTVPPELSLSYITSSPVPSGTKAIVVWDGNRATLPGDRAPGRRATVNLSVTAPATPGSHVLQIDTVQEAVTWHYLNQGASTVNTPVMVPSGREMTGRLTRDGHGDYWIGTTRVIPGGISVAGYVNRTVAAWGTVTPPDAYFLASDVEPVRDYDNGLNATTPYDSDLDCAVYTETVNGVSYAVARVRYHYPVPVPTLPMLLDGKASPLGNSETVYGKAEFPAGT